MKANLSWLVLLLPTLLLAIGCEQKAEAKKEGVAVAQQGAQAQAASEDPKPAGDDDDEDDDGEDDEGGW